MSAGIKGEYENLPSPIPMRRVAAPAIESRSHADEYGGFGDIDTLQSLTCRGDAVQ
jgi:hypothetical protein